MFESIKLRLFVAKVLAELEAQHNDPAFAKLICLAPSNLEHLNTLREAAYYRKDKIAPFLATCHILAESLNLNEIPNEEKKICAFLLAQRIEKASNDRHFWVKHVVILTSLKRQLYEWGANNIDGFDPPSERPLII